MNPPNLPATDTTPAVRFDASKDLLRFEGESYPEDVTAFYAPLLEWLRAHLATGRPLKLELAFTYLNTSSTKALLDLLLVLDEHHRRGGTVSVEWHYQANIEVMQEAGEEFGEDLALPFALVAID